MHVMCQLYFGRNKMRKGLKLLVVFLGIFVFFESSSVLLAKKHRQGGTKPTVRKPSSGGVKDKNPTPKKDGSRHLGGGKKRAAATSGGGSGSSTSTKRAAVGSKRAASSGGKSARFSRSSRLAGLVKSAGSGEAKLTGNPCPVDKLVGYDSAAQTYYSKKDVACDAPEHTEFVMEMFLVGWQNIIRKQKRII